MQTASEKRARFLPEARQAIAQTISTMAGQGSQVRALRSQAMGTPSIQEKAREAGCNVAEIGSLMALTQSATGSSSDAG